MNDDGYGQAWESQKDEWRRGNSSAQKEAALNAKATLAFIKANPGCTKEQIKAAGIRANFEMLTKHRLAYFTKGSPAQWFATGYNPSPMSGEKSDA